MIAIILLALPIICLLIGIVYFSVSLWRLNKKSISLEVAKSPGTAPIILEEDRSKIVPQMLTISDNIQIANSYELDEETIRILLCAVLLKQHSKIYKLDNLDDVLSKSILNSKDAICMSSKLLKNSAKGTRFDIVFQKKGKSLCQLQNLS